MFGHDNQDDENQQDNAIHPTEQHEHDTAAHQPQDDSVQPADDNSGGMGFEPTPGSGGHGAAAATDDLLDIKQEALQQLTPLVGQLDQTPEEQFRTTMMMIQASDNHSLVKVAYEAAKQISNEKERAQALLDIVNEINYFTQHNANAAA